MSEVGGRIGGLAGLVAATLFAAALATAPEVPTAAAPAEDAYTFFLDNSDGIETAALLVIVALLLSAALLSSIRLLVTTAGTGNRAAYAGAAMQATGLLAIGATSVSSATLAVGAIRAEDSDPATAQALLDVTEAGVAVAGGAFALTLLFAALAIRISGSLPRGLALLALPAALSCAFWLGRLFADSGALASDGFLGSTLGELLLLAWLAAASLILASRPSRPAGQPSLSRSR